MRQKDGSQVFCAVQMLSACVKEKNTHMFTNKYYEGVLPKAIVIMFTFHSPLFIVFAYISHKFERVCFSKNNALRPSSAYTNQPSPS